jgi:photosystem II stability/assembly factor-like uncharacterized protein
MTRTYVALPDAVLVVSNGTAGRQLDGSSPMCLAADPSRDGRIFCGTWDRGLLRSDDAGESWMRLGYEQVTAVAVDADGVVYAGTEPSTLYRSEDSGTSWTECRAMRDVPSAPTWSFPPRPHTSHVRWITPDPAVPGRIFVCIEAGALLRSTDGGETWQDRRPEGPIDTHTLVASGGRLYSAAGDGFILPGTGFSVSRDAAETWERPDEGLRDHYCWGVAVDGTDADTIVLSAAPGPFEAHGEQGAESTIYRRTGSTDWTESRDGLPPRAGTNASVLAWHEGAFYAANNVGLFRSTDAGASWEPLITLPGRAHALVIAG